MQLPFQTHSGNHEINICDTTELFGEKGSFRILRFADDAIQGAQDLNRPDRVVLAYQQAVVHLMALNVPAFEDVFVIGHGIGAIARHFADRRFKIAELDRQIVELSATYFGYALNNVVVGDGRALLEREKSHAYDYVILDAFTDKGTPRQLTSVEFFRMVSEKLDNRGAVILNVMGRGGSDPRIAAIHSTLAEVFGYIGAFALPAEAAHDGQNIVMIGMRSPVRFQARSMAGFIEIHPERGRVIMDG